MNKGHTTIVVDALWGDSAKGAVSNWIAYQGDYDIAVRAGTGTNAGHSMFVNGKCYKTNQLPLAGMLGTKSGKKMNIGVGASVMFDPIKAKREIDEYKIVAPFVDYRCSLILEEHKKREAEGEQYSESHTGSTKSGTGEARVDRVRRIGKRVADLSKEEQLYFNSIDAVRYLNDAYNRGNKIIIEGAQSYYLSLYLSNEYPVVTSSNCTATASADDVGLGWNKINDVCLCVKSAPTRVSQNCGILPGEISKKEIMARGIEERGVTTGRLRRKSLIIPFDLLEESVEVNGPTFFALTFCDHVDKIDKDLHLPEVVQSYDLEKIMPNTFKNIAKLQEKFGIPVKYINYGKEWNQISKVEWVEKWSEWKEIK
jgi:adenylosuccinate synthase